MSQLDFLSICNFTPVNTKHSNVLKSSHEILAEIVKTPQMNTIDSIISCMEQMRTSFENHTSTFPNTFINPEQCGGIMWVVEVAMMCIMRCEYGVNTLVFNDGFKIRQCNVKMLRKPVKVPLALVTYVRRF
ncbi:hypothetical protein PBCV1_a117L [Paramecium bursaria Chlorella virus 1]|uniref:Uncharacterized protein n=1 Tax=Paramecium bursaria Chlorella virus 1 TaxID=10506 RepID=Q84438_PBCV1|nr:hypothetical protein PBCV1_a117L [Paramecium bursaria Chlorella virus 1]AAC96485.1 hypothetical protein [Paramecium bursaria Chlorella virus 1]